VVGPYCRNSCCDGLTHLPSKTPLPLARREWFFWGAVQSSGTGFNRGLCRTLAGSHRCARPAWVRVVCTEPVFPSI
jgi:hypothetical protein